MTTYFQPGAHLAPSKTSEPAVTTVGPIFQPGVHLKATAPEEPVLGPVKTWSFSSLKKFESCPYSVWLAYGEKLKVPSGPAAERGTDIHALMEDYIQGTSDTLTPLDNRMRKFTDNADCMARVENLREAYALGKVEVEQDWGFTLTWEITGWVADDVWNRVKLDVLHWQSETSAHIKDWKTGKSFGNELKHAEQLLFYTVAAFKRYPQLEFVTADIEYIDEGRKGLEKHYSRAEALLFQGTINKRALAMTTAKAFPPKPSTHNCKWCDYKTLARDDGSVACPFGVL